jgi:hypothetical protein
MALNQRKKYIKRKTVYESSISSSFTIGNITAATIVFTFPSSHRLKQYRLRPSDGIRCVLLRLAKIIPEDHRYHSTINRTTSLAPITNHVTPKWSAVGIPLHPPNFFTEWSYRSKIKILFCRTVIIIAKVFLPASTELYPSTGEL